MDRTETEFIERNACELLHTIVCTDALLRRLAQQRILCFEDMSRIDAKKYESATSQTSLLLSILRTRTRGFDALLIALQATQQIEAVKILLHPKYKSTSRETLKRYIASGDFVNLQDFIKSGKEIPKGCLPLLILHDDLVYYCVKNSAMNSSDVIQGKIQILHYFFQEVSKTDYMNFTNILNPMDKCSTPLLAENVAVPLNTFLLSYGASVDVQDFNGNTVLHLAAMQIYMMSDSFHEIVQNVLLRDQTVANCLNHNGKTPLDLALSQSSIMQKTIDLLTNQCTA